MGGDYFCETCSQTFTRPQHVVRHQRIHTGTKPYPCLTCGERFTRSDLLTRHRIKFHGLVETSPTSGSPKKRRKLSVSSPVEDEGPSICRRCALDQSRPNTGLRCDGNRPSCAQCLVMSAHCSYPDAAPSAGPSTSGSAPPRRGRPPLPPLSPYGAVSPMSLKSPGSHTSGSVTGHSADDYSSGPSPFLDAYYRTHLPVSNTLGIDTDAAYQPQLQDSFTSASASGSGSSSTSYPHPNTPVHPRQTLSSVDHQTVNVDSPAAYVPHLNGFPGMFDAWGAVDGEKDLGENSAQYGYGVGHPGMATVASPEQTYPSQRRFAPSSSLNVHPHYLPPRGPTDAENEAQRQSAALDSLFLNFPHPDSVYGVQPSPYLATPFRGRSPVQAEAEAEAPPSLPSQPETDVGSSSHDLFRDALARTARQKGEGFQLKLDHESGNVFKRRIYGDDGGVGGGLVDPQP